MHENSYKKAWQDLEGREAIAKVIFWMALPVTIIPELAFIPCMMVAFFVFDLFSLRSIPWQISLFVIVAALVLVALSSSLLSFRCPRCDQLFFCKKFYLLRDPQYKEQCVHCGLAKGDTPDLEA